VETRPPWPDLYDLPRGSLNWFPVVICDVVDYHVINVDVTDLHKLREAKSQQGTSLVDLSKSVICSEAVRVPYTLAAIQESFNPKLKHSVLSVC
jgi:hypothetical protein